MPACTERLYQRRSITRVKGTATRDSLKLSASDSGSEEVAACWSALN